MGHSHVIPEIAKKVLSNKKSIIVFNPNHKRTFCFIDDFITALILLMKKQKLKHNIFNIGNKYNEINMYNLALKIIKYYGLKNKIKKKEINNSSPKRRIPDITRLERSIKFSNKFTLDQGLENVVLVQELLSEKLIN